jgi:adenine phosphoribosyltransferase
MKTLVNPKELILEIKETIKEIPNFPKKGIFFKDITPILKNGLLFQRTIRFFVDRYRDLRPDAIVCVESRGFLLGAPLASQLGIGVIPVRKKGKLPRPTRSITYELEYGSDTLEIHEEDLERAQRILFVDDVLATGGTTSAVIQLLEGLGCEIMEISFLIELTALKGRQRLKDYPVFSLIQY